MLLIQKIGTMCYYKELGKCGSTNTMGNMII